MKRKNLVILGATGSIGDSTLKVVRGNPERLNVLGIAGRKNYEKLRIYQTYPLRLISANVARTQAARSEGATLSCRPRTPALT